MRESIYIQRFLIFIAASFLFIMLNSSDGFGCERSTGKRFRRVSESVDRSICIEGTLFDGRGNDFSSLVKHDFRFSIGMAFNEYCRKITSQWFSQCLE